MNGSGFSWGYYTTTLEAAWQRAAGPAVVLAVTWFLIPFTIQMCFHPSDVVRFEHWFSGQAIPTSFTAHMLFAGEVTALVVLVILGLLLQGTLVVFYRMTQFTIALWPLAGIFLGVIGNLMWWMGEASQGFDFVGMLAGLAPLAATVIAEAGCEELGQDFVFGPGVRPRYRGW